MSLTTKLREYRARDKLSQEELARKVGVRRETIGNLENGKYNPPSSWLWTSPTCSAVLWRSCFNSTDRTAERTRSAYKTEPGVCISRRPARSLVYNQALAAAGKVIPPTLTFTAAISSPVMDSTAFFTASCTALPTSGMVCP